MSDLIHRRERIIFTAIEVMNELGVQALSTKRVAQYEKISESTVFKHFNNKNALLAAVLDFYSQYDLDLFETLELNQMKGLQGIYFFSDALMTYYENYPQVTAMTQGLDEMRYIEDLSERVESITSARKACFMRLLEEAKEGNEMKQEVETLVAAEMLINVLQGVVRNWRLEKYPKGLKERSHVHIEYLFKGIGT